MAELVFDNCRVPVENRLGEEGKGVSHMMRNLEIERLTLAAMSVGIAERCMYISLYHSHPHFFLISLRCLFLCCFSPQCLYVDWLLDIWYRL